MKILSVTPKRNFWLIETDDGQRVTTDDMFKASLAERAQKLDADVRILSGGGWFYKELRFIALAS